MIHVAVHPQPLPGKQVAEFLFGVLRDSLAEAQVTDEIVEGERAVVLFDTAVGGTPAQGLNVVRLDEGGLVRGIIVFFRPLEALQLIAEVVGPQMAARFGASARSGRAAAVTAAPANAAPPAARSCLRVVGASVAALASSFR